MEISYRASSKCSGPPMVDYRDRAGSSEMGVRNTGGTSNVSPREIYKVTGKTESGGRIFVDVDVRAAQMFL